MNICYTLNHSRGLGKNARTGVLALLFLLIAACSSPEERAAESAREALSYLQQNRIAEARLAITEAIEDTDDVADYHIIRGRIEFSDDALENAFAAYNQALALEATSQEALLAVSQLGLQIGRLRESLKATDRLLVINPNQESALLNRGLHALIARDFETANEKADRLLTADQNNEGGTVLKARASFLAGSPETAIKILSDYAEKKPNTSAVALTRLEIYRALRNAERMETQFLALQNLLPDDLQLRVDEANFHYKTGKRDAATRTLAKVLANKEVADETVNAALDLWREYAVNTIDRGLIDGIASSGKQRARIAAARYFADAGDGASAALLIDGLAGQDADSARAHVALSKGDTKRASSLASAIIIDDDTHCAARETLASIALAAEKYDDALRSAQRAVSECPRLIGGWELAALAYAGLDDPINARRVFRQGLSANQQSEPLTRIYAEWLLDNGNTREAIATARRITRIAPALMSGWKLYQDICEKTASPCTADAERGLADAQTRYGIDLEPGELPPNGLFGRFMSE